MLARYPKSAQELLFVVAGSGPYAATLGQEVQNAGLTEAFRLAGGVPNHEAIRYLAAADVYMMPSAEEGFPRTLIEAMAAGRPFTATDVGGVRDILTPEQAQFVTVVGDTQGMAASLVRLLTDDTLRESLIRAGHSNVEKYAQEKVIRTFISLVSE